MDKYYFILLSLFNSKKKHTENSSHQILNHVISRSVFPSGNESVISLFRYRFITPALPRSSRNLDAPLLFGAGVLPT